MRKLIDDHIESRGIDQTIAPMSITDLNFQKHVDKEVSPKAKASEMEHAVRDNRDKDPVHYDALSKRLEKILQELKDQWDAQVEALNSLIEDVKSGRKKTSDGLHPTIEAPIFDVLAKNTKGSLTETKRTTLRDLTIHIAHHLTQEVTRAGFWSKPEAQKALSSVLVQMLDDTDLFPSFEKLPAVADQVMALAKAHDGFLREGAGKNTQSKKG